MKVLILLSGLVKFIKCEDNYVSVERRFFIENYFWNADAEKNGLLENLFKVDFFIESKNKNPSGMLHDLNTVFYLEFTKMRYAIIPNWMKEDFDLFMKGFKDYKFFMRFHYSNLDGPVTGYLCLDDYKRENQVFNDSLVAHKEHYSVGLKFDKMETCNFNKKKIFKDLIRMNVLHLSRIFVDKKFKRIPSETLEKSLDFDLYYFKNYSECLKSLEKFIKILHRLKLVNDNKAKNLNGELSSESKTNLKISEFIDRLTRRFFKRKDIDSEEFCVSLKIFTWCCEYLKNEFLKKNIFLLIGDQYSIHFYLNEIFHIVNTFVTEHLRRFKHLNFEEEVYVNLYMNKCLDSSILLIEFKAVNDIFVSEYVHKYFSVLLGRGIQTLDDFKLVERIMCDYHNTFAYVVNMHGKTKYSECNLFNYCKPATVALDGYKYKVIDGIVIKFSDNIKSKQIKALDDKGIEVILKEGTDYFKNEWGTYHIISEVLMTKNVYSIEAIISSNLNEIFFVKDYLDT